MSDVASLPSQPTLPHATWAQRLAQAWSAGALPVVLLPALAMAFGPEGLDLVGDDVVAVLDPAVPVALATIGALAALRLPSGVPVFRVSLGSVFEAALTGTAVALVLSLVSAAVGNLDPAVIWIIASSCGVCAASSSLLASADRTITSRPESSVRDVDFVFPLVGGALLLTWMQQADITLAALAFGTLLTASIVVAAAGVLLATSVATPGEQRVFGMAIILLLGGIADSLGLSALLSGFCAGVLWRYSGAAVRETLTPVIAYIQHPLLVLMLLVAGLRVRFTVPLLALTGIYVAVRLAAKGAAGTAIAPLVQASPYTVAAQLAAPGVFGVALALTFSTANAELAPTIITLVVLGTAVSQLLQALAFPGTGQR